MATKNQTKDQGQHWPSERTQERALLVTVISRTLCSSVCLHSLRVKGTESSPGTEGGPGAEIMQLKRWPKPCCRETRPTHTQTSNSLTHKTQHSRDALFTGATLCTYLSKWNRGVLILWVYLEKKKGHIAWNMAQDGLLRRGLAEHKVCKFSHRKLKETYNEKSFSLQHCTSSINL